MHVGQRVSVNGYRGTVKYIGALDSSHVWIGLEWDDPARGKHSGTYQNRQIYACRPGCGSFLKESKTVFDQPRTLLEAVQYKYLDQSRGQVEEVAHVSGISRPIQSIGFDKVREKNRDLSAKSELLLEGLLIDRLDDTQLEGILDLSRITTLDLSWNLLSDIADVLTFCQKLPALKTVKLEGNRFHWRDCATKDVVTSVSSLDLSLTNIQWDQVTVMLNDQLCNLETLLLAYNDLGDLSRQFEDSRIQTLDLQGNKVSEIYSVLRRFRSLEDLNLASNAIAHIANPDSDVPTTLRHLNLAGNPLKDLKDASHLACLPRLQSLQYTLTFDDRADEMTRLRLIQYLPQLQLINKTRVTQQERQDAARLDQAYAVATPTMSENIITLQLRHGDRIIEKHVLKKSTVKQLRTLFARWAGLKSARMPVLEYSASEHEGVNVPLTDDLAQLTYYDISDGGIVHLAITDPASSCP